MRPFFPALLTALFAGWCGTLGWGGLGSASATAVLVLLGTVAAAELSWSELRDPLGLSPRARAWPGALPWGIWGWCLLSSALSPVPRSGRVALILLPAFLLLPRIVARCLETERGARLAARALSLAASAIALWALGDWLVLGSPRPAMPLGHHNLLALVLVTLLPLAALPAGEEGGWRWAGRLAIPLLVVTLLASRSLVGLAALLAQAGATLAWSRDSARRRQRSEAPVAGAGVGPDGGATRRARGRRSARGALVAFVLTSLVGTAWAGGRLLRIAEGVDPSLRARGVYWKAGAAGFAARPIVGWGPGSTPWTLAAFVDPIPGVNPPGEGVGELHDLPLALAYEVGLPGMVSALVLAALFLRARLRESPGRGTPEGVAQEGALRRAGILGGIGAGVALLGSAAIGVTALPVVVAVAAGFAMSPPPRGGLAEAERSRSWGGGVYAGVALAVLLPILLAQLRYDQARRAGARGERKATLLALSRAAALDPSFPLYRWRLALVEAEGGAAADREAAGQALRAARDGRGIARLWESAGILGVGAGRSWAPRALARAARLDPMSALAPFWLAASGSSASDPPAPEGEILRSTRSENGARALLGEPRLLRACLWRRAPERLDEALAALLRWPGIDAGWKEALLAEAERSRAERAGVAGGDGHGAEDPPTEGLAPVFDLEGASSISIFLFHRQAWPVRGPAVTLCGPPSRIPLPSAWELATTSPAALRVGTAPARAVRGQDLLTP